ncbi:MAG: hypothetical protein ABIB65_05065, partial [Candidatus Margulisiibacteriota bacterium]
AFPEYSNKCFVAIDFADEYDSVYKQAIEPVLRTKDFEPIYLKEKDHNKLIDDEIIVGIESSRFIIAEFSSVNPNVYFEAGYARALNLEVIGLCSERAYNDEKLQFDVEHYSAIIYKDLEELRKKLVKRIDATVLVRSKRQHA